MKKFFILALLPMLLCSCGGQQGKEFSIHTDLQNKMLNDSFENVNDYVDGFEHLSDPKPVEIDFSDIKENGIFEFEYGEEGNDKPVKIIQTSNKKVSLINLKIATKYWYKVHFYNVSEILKSDTFEIKDSMIRNLSIDGMTNCRDVGGLLTYDGRRTKQGLIYRTARLDEYNSEGDFMPIISKLGKYTFVKELGVKTEIDLRSIFEVPINRQEIGSALGEEVNFFWKPMIWTPLEILWSTLNDNAEMIKEVFDVFGEKENYPIDFHCRIGTDRTGLVAYLINAVLGVDEKYIKYDYLFSNFGSIDGPRSMDNYNISFANFFATRPEATLQQKVTNYLVEIGVEKADLDVLKEVMLG